MNFFSKEERKAVILILFFIVCISAPNYWLSLRRARDAQRKADIGSIHDALLRYHEDFGSFPLSLNGKIAACAPFEIQKQGEIAKIIYSACNWGQDSLADLSDPNYPPYLKNLPQDPYSSKGVSYYYLANDSRFQIYGALEGKSEDEYDEAIIKRNLPCGNKICNFGKAFGRTPLDKSIEEYENEINEKR